MKVMIATHGNFAKGIQNTLALFIGEERANRIQTINAYLDDSDYTAELQAFIDSVQSDDFGVIFTDLYGGSVNQKAVLLNNKDNVVIITGMNLPVIMEVVLAEITDMVELQSAIENARNELQLVQLHLQEGEQDTDSFFG